MDVPSDSSSADCHCFWQPSWPTLNATTIPYLTSRPQGPKLHAHHWPQLHRWNFSFPVEFKGYVRLRDWHCFWRPGALQCSSLLCSGSRNNAPHDTLVVHQLVSVISTRHLKVHFQPPARPWQMRGWSVHLLASYAHIQNSHFPQFGGWSLNRP